MAVLRCQCHPDADVGPQRDALKREWLGQGCTQLDSDDLGLAAPGIAEQDRELVAAETGEHVRAAQLLGEPRPHLHQEPVPDVVPEAVVDLFELVQVQEQEGLLPACSGQLSLDLGVESAPTRQTGQIIGRRLPPQVGQAAQLTKGQLRTSRGGAEREGREADGEQ